MGNLHFPPPPAPGIWLPGMFSLQFLGSRELRECRWVSSLATEDPKQAAWVPRMFSLEETLFLEFLFFAGDDEWEVTLGVTVDLSSFLFIAQYLQKHKSWGKEEFGGSTRRTLQRPSFLMVDKISPNSLCLSIHQIPKCVSERVMFPPENCGIDRKIRAITKFSLIIKMISLLDNLATLPLIQARKYHHLYYHDCWYCYNHHYWTLTRTPCITAIPPPSLPLSPPSAPPPPPVTRPPKTTS